MSLKILVAAATFAMATLFGGAAHAQDEARSALARELMTVLGMETQLTGMFDALSPMVATSMARDLHLDAVEEARLGQLVAEEFRNATPSMVAQMAEVYAARMSEAQLRETVTFLRSSSGAAFLQTQVSAQQELERIGGEAGMQVGLQALQRLNSERRR